MAACPATEDFFRGRLDHMIDLRHPLAILASRMPWQAIEAQVAQIIGRKARQEIAMSELDLFGERVRRVPTISNAGRLRIPLRILIALLYLKHAFDASDEGVVERWAENPYWQYFSSLAYFEARRPCDATTLIKFRQLLGEEGVEELLAQTINVAVELQLIAPEALKQVIVDSTVQEKAIAHPTDSRLLETAREKLVEAAKAVGLSLKQTFAREGRVLSQKAGRYAHARQFRRLRRTIRRQRTIVGRLQREIERKRVAVSEAVQGVLAEALGKARRIVAQSAQRKAVKGQPKLYSWHAPEVDCISKGKARKPFEFGVKVNIAIPLSDSLIVGARAFHGNPYDGHTLNEQMDQTTILMQDIPVRPTTAFVDLGYRGVDADNPDLRIVHRGKAKRLTTKERKDLRRRQAIEPVIGHLKTDHRLGRCPLKGAMGDCLHAVLCAAGYNLRWLLRAIARKGIAFLFCCLARLWMLSVLRDGFRPVAHAPWPSLVLTT